MRIACLLLAAGAGNRFGGCKQLALIDGKLLVRHSLETLASIFGDELYIMLGAHRADILPIVDDLASVIVHNDWRCGIGSSIAHGIREIEALGNYDGILIALADQPRISVHDFNMLVEKFDGSRIVAGFYAGHPGVPAIFPASLFDHLKQLDEDHGAKALLMGMRRDIETVDLPAAIIDIDTREDAER